MSIKSPVYPMPESQHFSDYGFDPLTEYFQFLEEARKHKVDASSPDAFQFKLQKLVPAEESEKAKKKRNWWKNALLFWKRNSKEDEPLAAARNPAIHTHRAVSGPLYGQDCGLNAPCRRSSRGWSGPFGGVHVPTGAYGIRNPYISLRELNRLSLSNPSSSPIYLVT